jgi:hypothetical protein
MEPEQIRAAVKKLDTVNPSQQDSTWDALKNVGENLVPYLIEFYPHTRKWQGRASILKHCVRYAEKRSDVVQLGLNALQDKSSAVRFRACELLARSLNPMAIPNLKKLLNHSDRKTLKNASLAIKSIRRKNFAHFWADLGDDLELNVQVVEQGKIVFTT